MASAQGLYYLHMTNGRPSGAMVLGKVSGPGDVLLIWIIIGQGPIALAVGAGWGCLDIFSRQSFLFSFFLSGTARYRLKYCLNRPFNPKTTNQQIL